MYGELDYPIRNITFRVIYVLDGICEIMGFDMDMGKTFMAYGFICEYN